MRIRLPDPRIGAHLFGTRSNSAVSAGEALPSPECAAVGLRRKRRSMVASSPSGRVCNAANPRGTGGVGMGADKDGDQVVPAGRMLDHRHRYPPDGRAVSLGEPHAVPAQGGQALAPGQERDVVSGLVEAGANRLPRTPAPYTSSFMAALFRHSHPDRRRGRAPPAGTTSFRRRVLLCRRV
jgi:hypothetical protein